MELDGSNENQPSDSQDAVSLDEERRRVSDHDTYFNSQFQAEPIYLEPGQTLWSNSDENMIVATVGAGVMLSIHDSDLKLGSVGYVLLPDVLLQSFPYFDNADQEVLDKAFQPIIDCVGHMKRLGANKSRIRIRLMGGGQLPHDENDRGTKNHVFIREYMSRKGLSILNEDMGGLYVRRIHFFPTTGRAVRMVLKRGSDFEDMQSMEEAYQKKIAVSKA